MMVASYTANGEAFVASKPRISATTDLDVFDVSPDGKRFAAVQEEQSDRRNPAQVIFLLNFFDELRRRAPSETK
jgi:hypothetical protein